MHGVPSRLFDAYYQMPFVFDEQTSTEGSNQQPIGAVRKGSTT
jgi:hypothetical protein